LDEYNIHPKPGKSDQGKERDYLTDFFRRYPIRWGKRVFNPTINILVRFHDIVILHGFNNLAIGQSDIVGRGNPTWQGCRWQKCETNLYWGYVKTKTNSQNGV
jgi:hypothetical protein